MGLRHNSTQVSWQIETHKQSSALTFPNDFLFFFFQTQTLSEGSPVVANSAGVLQQAIPDQVDRTTAKVRQTAQSVTLHLVGASRSRLGLFP